MITNYTTSDGDMLDQIAYQYYGTLNNHSMEQLLAANPQAAACGPLLPVGLVLTMPVILAQVPTTGVKLWT